MPKRHHNIRLSEACAVYVKRVEAEGKALATVQFTGKVLTRLRATLKGDPYVHIISPAMLDNFCYGAAGIRTNSRTGTPMSAGGFNRYVSVLRGFFGHALALGWTSLNPMTTVSALKADPERPRLLLNASELLAMLEHCCNPLERFACALAMNTGLRAGDLTRLTVFDVSLAGGTIQTQIRKTGKYDIKPVTMELHQELVRWLDTYADLTRLTSPAELADDWYLIPTYRTPSPREVDRRIKLRPLTRHQTPYRLVQRPLARMGYPTRQEGFHTLRRSSARIFFETLRSAGDGRDHALMVVQDFLNHSSTVQTQRYLGLNQERAIRNLRLQGQPFLSAAREHEQDRLNTESARKVEHIGKADRRAV